MTAAQVRSALFGAALLSFVLGSLHAFSVLLLTLESEFATSRSAASATYSAALVSLAAAVFLGHRLYARFSPAVYVCLTGGIAASGCVLAAFGSSIFTVWIGFGLIFGAANGLGYGYTLQLSGRILPARKGLAMGIITAAYALGAVVFPAPLGLALESGGWSASMLFLALCLLVASWLSAAALTRSQVIYTSDSATPSTAPTCDGRHVLWLWLSYCGAVTAGLLVIGHATGVVATRGDAPFWITLAPIVIASANMAGSLLGGVLTDRLGGRLVLLSFAGLSFTALLLMAFTPQIALTMFGLAVVGFTYGGTIATYPAYVCQCFGQARGPAVYGRVFTAWAAAGLLGPSAAGMLYDRHGSYSMALILAATAAAVAFFILLVKAPGRAEA